MEGVRESPPRLSRRLRGWKTLANLVEAIAEIEGSGDSRPTTCSTWPPRRPWSRHRRPLAAGLARRRAVPDGGGEAVRSRPSARAPEPPSTRSSRSARSTGSITTWQGDGPEHPGVPFRQRALRADLGPALHRPRADHGGRGGGGGAPRRLLRAGGGAARHGPEPPVPGPLSGGDGAAGLLRRRRDPQQEGGRAARHPPHPARGGPPARGAGPVRTGLDPRARRSTATAPRTMWTRTRSPRPSPR